MKPLDSIFGSRLSGRFRNVLVATIIATAPISAYARGGGGGGGGFHGGGGGGFHGGGGGGFGHMGGGGFSPGGGGGFSHMSGGGGIPNFGSAGGVIGSRGSLHHLGSAGGFVRGGDGFSHMGGVAGGGIANNPSHNINPVGNIPALHRGDTLGNTHASPAPLADSQGAHNAANHAHIYHRFADIQRHGDRFGDFRFRKDRLFRTRDFLVGLVDFGWPIGVVDNWCDAIVDDEIQVGMPAELVLDYWGDPILVNTLTLPSGVGQVWTYRSPTSGTVRVTIMNDRVTSVQQT